MELRQKVIDLECVQKDLREIDQNSQAEIDELKQKNKDWEVFNKKLFKDIKDRQVLRRKDNELKMQ